MKKTTLFTGLLAFGILLPAIIGSAQTVTMNFISGDGNSSGGFYVFPYYFTINSGTNTNLLMCDTFTVEITPGESWGATILAVANLTISDVSTLEFGSEGVLTYLEACYLYQEELAAYNSNNSDPQGLYNWAVWDLFSGGTGPSTTAFGAGSSQETTIESYLSAAEAQGSSLLPSDFAGMYIVTPTNTAAAQEFFGECTIPEPGTFALVALAVGGLALIRKRKQATISQTGKAGRLPGPPASPTN